MRRKLVKQGTSTLMISLPSKWTKKFSLDKGDEVNVEESQEDQLIISSAGIEKKSETHISLSNINEPSIRAIITNAYKSGYDKVWVSFNNESQFNILDNVIKTKIIGFDIIKKEKDHCIVENITEPSADQFEAILLKIFYNISNSVKLTKERIKNKKVDESYIEVEDRIKRYDNFCKRVITKKKIYIKKSELLWSFLTILVHAERQIYHLNVFLDKHKINISDETISLFDDAVKVFDFIKEAYYKKDITKLELVHELEKEIVHKKGYRLLESKSGKENVVIYHLISSIRTLHLSTSPLIGLLV